MNIRKVVAIITLGGGIVAGIWALGLLAYTGHADAQTPTPTKTPTPAERCVGVKYVRGDWGYSRAKNEAAVFQQAKSVTVGNVTFWQATWTGALGTHESMFDLDHQVSLAEAHKLGGCQWNKKAKAAFANDIITDAKDTLTNLYLTTPGFNAGKGGLSPAEIAAIESKDSTVKATLKDKATATGYCRARHAVLTRYRLTKPETESQCVNYLVSGVANPTPVVTPTSSSTLTPAPTPTRRTYASCAAADSAGETLVQGNKGKGKGYPQWMVPTARDGDKDGIVCER